MKFLALVGLCLLGLVTASAVRRPDPAPADILVTIDKSAPEGVVLMVQVGGDTTSYEASGVLKHVCIPVYKVNPDYGIVAAVVFAKPGFAPRVEWVVWDPTNEGLEHLNIVADSAGVFPHFGVRHTSCQ